MSAQQIVFNPTELLFRQVHPTFIQDFRVTSQAFKPTPKDELKLSVSRSSLTTAKEAFELYTEKRKLDSVGVWALEVKEVNELMPLPDRIESNPLTLPIPDAAHCLINFETMSKNQIDSTAKKLAAKARERGCLHPE